MDYQDYKNFIEAVKFTAKAHQENALPEAKKFREFPSGEANQYYTHCLWGAIMILLDTKLPASIREPGAYALLYHDALEDTSLPLPENTPREVRKLVDEMTYVIRDNRGWETDWQYEKTAVLKRPPLTQLLKLYDKVATLYDGCTPKGKKLQEWVGLTKKLTSTVEKEYGELNIVLLSRALTEKYERQLKA